ncbi:hypothetical protein [Flavitalea sp.]|nr:hypothetical protein [Flavitalea sp.]
MKKYYLLAGVCFLFSHALYAQAVKLAKNELEAVNVSMSVERLGDKEVVKVIMDTSIKKADQSTFVRLKGIDFQDGTIELKVLSKLTPNAPDYARGFIGVAFRINSDNTKFESMYIRPTNGRAEDQLRRNHATQYFSFPDYGFQRLRDEAAGQYESYADMGLNEWISLRIVVRGAQAKLFLNNNKQPVLIVNDLKLGAENKGAIGLWVDVGTEGYFSDLKISKEK